MGSASPHIRQETRSDFSHSTTASRRVRWYIDFFPPLQVVMPVVIVQDARPRVKVTLGFWEIFWTRAGRFFRGFFGENFLGIFSISIAVRSVFRGRYRFEFGWTLVGGSPRPLTCAPLSCYTAPVFQLPAFDAASRAVAELFSGDAEPGEWVRCLVCTHKRLMLWAPGLMRCDKCHSVAAFLGMGDTPPRRLQCRRRCRRRLFYLMAGQGARPASWRCTECGEERAVDFEVARYGVLKAEVRPRSWKWPSSMAIRRRKLKRMREREPD